MSATSQFMRTPAKNYEEFYQRLLEEGMHFVRGKVSEVTDAARKPEEEGRLIVQYEDTLLGKQKRLPVDNDAIDVPVTKSGVRLRFIFYAGWKESQDFLRSTQYDHDHILANVDVGHNVVTWWSPLATIRLWRLASA